MTSPSRSDLIIERPLIKTIHSFSRFNKKESFIKIEKWVDHLKEVGDDFVTAVHYLRYKKSVKKDVIWCNLTLGYIQQHNYIKSGLPVVVN